MFERFRENSVKVVMLAQEEARRLGHNFVGTEQLLLGLIAEGEGIAAQVLKSMGVNLRDARIEVENIIGRGSGSASVEIPFTPRGKKALENAFGESSQFRHRYINTEHLVLGLIRVNEGVAVRVLENLGINLDQLRNEVIRKISDNVDEVEEYDNIPKIDFNLLIIQRKIHKQIRRLNVILAEAQKIISEIEPFLQYKSPTYIQDIDNLIDELPNSTQDNEPGIKELLRQLHTAITADSELNSEDRTEALEQVLVLAAAGQNPTIPNMRKSAKTALKILKATISELPATNQLVTDCNQLLPKIANFFDL
jgi:ATP-dependent Clp protease ATP-binding subunit ClpC